MKESRAQIAVNQNMDESGRLRRNLKLPGLSYTAHASVNIHD